MKKQNILIIICSILVFAAIIGGGFWYFYKNAGSKNGNQEIAFSTGFILLDDEKNLLWSEVAQLDPEVRANFEKKVSEIKADLTIAKEKEQLLADYNNLGMYQKFLGNYKEAYNAYLESIKIENKARVAWQNFADVLLKMRAYKSAEMAYKKAVQLNKYIPESYVKLGNYYQAVGDANNVEATYKLGIETIKESMESDTLILDAYAEWLVGQKRYDEAIEIYKQLIAKQPNNKEAIERNIENIKNKQ